MQDQGSERHGHRPVIHQHGRRFRFKDNGAWRTFDTLEKAQVAAEAKLQQRIRDEGIKQVSHAGGLPVRQVLDAWWSRHARELQPATVRGYESLMRHVVGFDALDARSLLPRQVQSICAGLAPVVAVRLHSVLRQAFQDAVLNEELDRNVFTIVRPRRPATHERVIPTADEVGKIVRSAWEHSDLMGFAVETLATLGLRRGEMLALFDTDFDLDASVVHVRRKAVRAQGGMLLMAGTKTQAGRILPFGPTYASTVAAYCAGREGRLVDLAPDTFTRYFRRITSFTPHSLRHFVAVQLLSVKQHPLVQVARYLGHKNPSITLDLYGNHILGDEQRRIASDTDALFDRP